jgi:hypothetical protein
LVMGTGSIENENTGMYRALYMNTCVFFAFLFIYFFSFT